MYWAALIVAIVANITSNVALKLSVVSVEAGTPLEMLMRVATRPLFWVGILAAGVLFGAYIFALRQIELSVAYIFVTVSAIVGITAVSAGFLDESLGFYKVLGILMVIAGLAFVFKSS